MQRQIIHIDREKCTGCGLCAAACHEGAIGMQDGKAVLLREDYCDGMGDCLPACPADAIAFERREAPAYDSAAVQRPQWPIQLKLAAPTSAHFADAHLLIAADCTAFTYPAFYNEYRRGRAVVIGCPKLDGEDYTERLAEILTANDVQSVTVLRMEVPCCGALERAAQRAVFASGKEIPLRVATVTVDGKLR